MDIESHRATAKNPASTASDLDGLELLEPAEVARLLHVSTVTLNAWRSTRPRELPFVKISPQRVRYRAVDVQRFIETHRVCVVPERTAA